MKNILVLGNFPHRTKDLTVLLKGVNQGNEFKVTFIVDQISDDLREEIKANNFSVLDFYGKTDSLYRKVAQKSTSTARKKSFRSNQSIRRALKIATSLAGQTSFMQLIKKRRLLERFSIDYKRAAQVFDEVVPDVVIVEGDRALGIEPSILKVARERNVLIMVPYMAYSDEGLSFRSNLPELKLKLYSSLFVRIVFRRFQNQAIRHHKDNLHYYNSYTLAALSQFGTLSQYPWMVGNGVCDVVCVDSRHNYDRYVSMRVPEKKMRIVGDVSYDMLFEKYQEKERIWKDVAERYKLDPGKKIIICSMPQLVEENIIKGEQAIQALNNLVKQLSETGFNLLLSLHPRMEYEKYRYLEDQFSCRILDERLYEVLPIADLFCTISLSSTIIWAVICGIKSIGINYYGYSIGLYKSLNAVKVISKDDSLCNIAHQHLNAEVDFAEDWRQLSRDDVFDGNCMGRYRKLILETVK